MKALLSQAALVLAEVLAVALVVYLAYRKLTSAAEALPSFDKVATSAGQIVTSIPGLIGSAVRGENEGTYITPAQARALAAEKLAAHQRMAAE